MEYPEDQLKQLDKDMDASLKADMLLAVVYPEFSARRFSDHEPAYAEACELAIDINRRFEADNRFGERCTLAGVRLMRPRLQRDEQTGLPMIVPECIEGQPGAEPSFTGYFDHAIPLTRRDDAGHYYPEINYQLIAPEDVVEDTPFMIGRPKVMASVGQSRVEFISDIQAEQADRSIDALSDLDRATLQIIDDINDLLYREDNHDPIVLAKINRLFISARRSMNDRQANALRELIESQLAWYPQEEFMVEGTYEMNNVVRPGHSKTNLMSTNVVMRGLVDGGKDKGLFVVGTSHDEAEGTSYVRLSLDDIVVMERVMKLRYE